MSTAQNPVLTERGWNQHSAAAPPRPSKPTRRLKPEVAERLKSRRGEVAVAELYEKPVQELSPQELALMRAAFLRG